MFCHLPRTPIPDPLSERLLPLLSVQGEETPSGVVGDTANRTGRWSVPRPGQSLCPGVQCSPRTLGKQGQTDGHSSGGIGARSFLL